MPGLPINEQVNGSVKPLSEDAPYLDWKLRLFIRHRLKTLTRFALDGQELDDIANSTWSRALKKYEFHSGCTQVRIQYLRTTARNYILNLIRSESTRAEALEKNWDKPLLNGTAIRAQDGFDNWCSLADQGAYEIAHYSAYDSWHCMRCWDSSSFFSNYSIAGIQFDLALKSIADDRLAHDMIMLPCQHYRNCGRCRFRWFCWSRRGWRNSPDENLSRIALNSPIDGFVSAYVSMKVGTNGETNERDYFGDDCGCCWGDCQ